MESNVNRSRRYGRTLSLSFAVLCLFPGGAFAQPSTGRITGKVLDEANAMTLPTAPVVVTGSELVAHTDLDGVFALDLPAGEHEIKVAFSGYKEQTVKVRVVPGEVVKVDFALSGSLAFSEQIAVVASAEAPSSQAAMIVERKRSGIISEALGSDEMKKNADSDAAAAMQRVTGLSIVDGQYVYVRGLGERYSNTTLNGSILPTTEPDKRVVPLDLFPTGLIESVRITKSYSPDKPADFAGGLVEIEPINFPSRATLSASISGGWNSQATFESLLGYPGSGSDWLSYDGGRRALPGSIPSLKVSPAGIFGGGFSPSELEAFGESFDNTWDPSRVSAPPDFGANILAGNSWGKFGVVGSVTWNRQSKAAQEEQNFYKVGAGNEITVQNAYDFEVATTKANLGGVLNLAYRFSGNHRLAWENFYSHNSKNETRVFEGFNNDIRAEIRNQRLYWIEEGILSSKISGEHLLQGLGNSRLDWAGTFSLAKRDEPDLREALYEFNDFTDTFVLADESQSGFRMFNESDDKVYEGRFDWMIFLNEGSSRPTMIKVGPTVTYRRRDFSSRRFRMIPRDTSGIDLTQSPEVIFAAPNIGTAFQLNEETRATDAYEAEQTIAAGYAMVDLPLTRRLRFVGGARVESSEQTVDTFDPFNPSAAVIASTLDNTDVLPGLNLIYQVGADMNLRASYSHTVNRPEFRELAPFEFTDVVGGRAVVGNPGLKRALIRNVDLRWEWFPAGGSADAEVIAISAFYKDFDNPIERVVEATAQLRTSYQNAAGAKNKGFELEARKAVGDRLLLGLNYTWVDSSIELLQTAGQVQTSLNRPLAGQSPNLLNGMIEWRSKGGWSARVLGNYFDDRIADVGALGLPDILEEGRLTVDFSLQRRFGDLALRLSADNLTNATIRYTQGGLDQRTYNVGRGVSLSLSYARQ